MPDIKPTAFDTSQIVGWGVDADPENDPTWPMRDRSQDTAPDKSWTRPSLQPESVEVLRSNEHVRMPAVFGTASPPSGLSGVLRRRAFLFSESQWAHWLLLIAADRVNVVEGLLQDLAHGRIPNIFAEMGIGAEMRHNKRAFAVRTTIQVTAVATLIGVGWYLLRSRRGRSGLFD